MRTALPAIVLICGASLCGCEEPAPTEPTDLLVPALAASKAGSSKDRVAGAGTGERIGVGFSFEVSAQSGPTGENPRGKLEGVFGGASIAGKVTCLAVVNNRAAIGMEQPGEPGNGFYLVVVNHGPPGTAILDQATFFTSTIPADEAGCALLSLEALATHSIDGDIVVEDATP